MIYFPLIHWWSKKKDSGRRNTKTNGKGEGGGVGLKKKDKGSKVKAGKGMSKVRKRRRRKKEMGEMGVKEDSQRMGHDSFRDG